MAIGDRHILGGLYYNTGGYACAVAAVITESIDWAAYMGGCSDKLSWDEAYQFVADQGCKLPKDLAKFMFPDIKLPYRE